jgi:hypothetical protein
MGDGRDRRELLKRVKKQAKACRLGKCEREESIIDIAGLGKEKFGGG